MRALLVEHDAALREVDPGETGSVLRAACQGFCPAGAAGSLLALCADRERSSPRCGTTPRRSWRRRSSRCRARRPWREGRGPGSRGRPGEAIGDDEAEEVRHAILRLALTLNTVLPAAADRAGAVGDRDACR
ncbi:hypothetical protein ACIRL2_26540 [Embleya sp. NPDC127516]|uniref:hypothetical protein n=1 Tax=Embleya sp. NPDC127516 TaxID=3363990 RepID=UPI0038069EBD